MAVSFKGSHFPAEIILTGVRWYLAYPLSYRQVEELLEERGVSVDHTTIQRMAGRFYRTSLQMKIATEPVHLPLQLDQSRRIGPALHGYHYRAKGSL
jgi:transposase-like protein